MQIFSINGIQQKFNQNFKGLWGAEKKNVMPAYHNTNNGLIYVGDSLNLVYKDYHPFLNETKEEIYKAQEELKSKDIHDRKIGNEFTHNVYNIFVEKERLPFTSKSYEDYTLGKLIPKTKSFIEENLKKANLHMFIKK